MMLDSGVSNVWLDGPNGRMFGACINCVWPVEDKYDAFEVDPTEWLNTAAELAEVVGFCLVLNAVLCSFEGKNLSQ